MSIESESRFYRIKLSKSKRNKLIKQLLSFDCYIMDADKLNEMLVNGIIQSAKETKTKSTGMKSGKKVPLWNNDCSEAIKVRNGVFRKLKK